MARRPGTANVRIFAAVITGARLRGDGYVCTAADVEAEFTRIGHVLQPGDIVLVNTAVGARYGHDDFINRGCGMGREATCAQ